MKDDFELYFMIKEELKQDVLSLEEIEDRLYSLRQLEDELRKRRWEWERYK